MWSTHQGSLWTHPRQKTLLGLSVELAVLGGLWFYQGRGGPLLMSRWQGNEDKNLACTRRSVTGLSVFALWCGHGHLLQHQEAFWRLTAQCTHS